MTGEFRREIDAYNDLMQLYLQGHHRGIKARVAMSSDGAVATASSLVLDMVNTKCYQSAVNGVDEWLAIFDDPNYPTTAVARSPYCP